MKYITASWFYLQFISVLILLLSFKFSINQIIILIFCMIASLFVAIVETIRANRYDD